LVAKENPINNEKIFSFLRSRKRASARKSDEHVYACAQAVSDFLDSFVTRQPPQASIQIAIETIQIAIASRQTTLVSVQTPIVNRQTPLVTRQSAIVNRKIVKVSVQTTQVDRKMTKVKCKMP